MIESSNNRPWKLIKRVLPQHTDHAGVMWHGSYVSWLEEARIEALNQVGITYMELSLQGFEMPVVSLEINYIRALRHGEIVLLESNCLPREGARWPWVTRFMKENDVVAKARVELVLIQRSGNNLRVIKSIPEQISSPLLKLQCGPSMDL